MCEFCNQVPIGGWTMQAVGLLRHDDVPKPMHRRYSIGHVLVCGKVTWMEVEKRGYSEN